MWLMEFERLLFPMDAMPTDMHDTSTNIQKYDTHTGTQASL